MNPPNVNPIPVASPAQPVAPTVVELPPTQPVPTTPLMNPKPNLPALLREALQPRDILPKIKSLPRKFKIMGGFVLVLLILLILVSFTNPGKRVKQLILPSPSPIPTTTPAPQVFIETPYAKDQEVLDIEKQMTDFDSKLGSTDLREDTLRIPTLDYNVNFKNQ